MLANEYLYGEDIEVPEIPAEIVCRRIELLKDNLEVLLEQSYYIRDLERCSKVLKAISFWEDINKDGI